MPCFLFTYHAHGTWLPNRKQGYVKRGQGILPPDEDMHRLYTQAMKEPEVSFDNDLQLELIKAIIGAAPHQRFKSYFIASDATHLHALVGWRHNRRAKDVKSQLKWSLSYALNGRFGKRNWLVDGGSGQQVKGLQHFNHLRNIYLPKHNGWKWNPERGFFK